MACCLGVTPTALSQSCLSWNKRGQQLQYALLEWWALPSLSMQSGQYDRPISSRHCFRSGTHFAPTVEGRCQASPQKLASLQLIPHTLGTIPRLAFSTMSDPEQVEIIRNTFIDVDNEEYLAATTTEQMYMGTNAKGQAIWKPVPRSVKASDVIPEGCAVG